MKTWIWKMQHPSHLFHPCCDADADITDEAAEKYAYCDPDTDASDVSSSVVENAFTSV